MTIRTEFDFTLPKGYVDNQGTLHREGTMRLATARDELEPLRDPRISGPEDPFLTVMVLARVLTRLGTVRQITTHEVEGLFAVDLAFLQDFYGVINFGSDEDIAALVAAQGGRARAAQDEVPAPAEEPAGPSAAAAPVAPQGGRRHRVEEVSASDR